jgi:hypothetical protein
MKGGMRQSLIQSIDAAFALSQKPTQSNGQR